MKSMRPPLAAIFFMTYFYRVEGGGRVYGPFGPTGSATVFVAFMLFSVYSDWVPMIYYFHGVLLENIGASLCFEY